MSRTFVAFILCSISMAGIHAQEKPSSADKQKTFAAEAMKKSEVKDARVIETANLGARRAYEDLAATLAEHVDEICEGSKARRMHAIRSAHNAEPNRLNSEKDKHFFAAG